MSDQTDDDTPMIEPSRREEIAPGVHVIADGRVPLVPNVGIVEGERKVLVVDCGMGPENGRRVREAAEAIAKGRPLILTVTHFHPEHGFGASAFRGRDLIVYNRSQAEELAEKGERYVEMFRGFGPGVVRALDGVELVEPDETYEDRLELDLGGRTAVLETFGTAHSRGDQIVRLPAEAIVFAGDLAEERAFPIFPYFPPEDIEIDADNWRRILAAQDTSGLRVVPGHGAVSGTDLLAAMQIYMDDMERRVANRMVAGETPEAAAAALKDAVRADYAAWDFPEWIEPALRFFGDRRAVA